MILKYRPFRNIKFHMAVWVWSKNYSPKLQSVVPWALKYSLMPTSLAGILILADWLSGFCWLSSFLALSFKFQNPHVKVAQRPWLHWWSHQFSLVKSLIKCFLNKLRLKFELVKFIKSSLNKLQYWFFYVFLGKVTDFEWFWCKWPPCSCPFHVAQLRLSPASPRAAAGAGFAPGDFRETVIKTWDFSHWGIEMVNNGSFIMVNRCW